MELNGAKILYTIHTDIPVLGDFKISQTLVSTWIVMALLSGFAIWLGSNLKLENVSKRQAAAEFIVERLDQFVHDNMGYHFDQYIPLIGAIFALSIGCNLISVIGLWSPTADLNTEAAWAIVVFVLIMYYKIKTNGILSYLKGLLDPIFIMAPINVLSEVSPPVSMAFRHFGNILSGTVISTLLYWALASLSHVIFGWLPGALSQIQLFQIGIPAFTGRAGATYPAAGASKPTPKPTVAPEFESSEFKYDGLDQNWIDKNIDPEKPVVALSFDDGPGGYTGFVDNGMKIQKALTAAGAHATFFYIGAHIEHDEDSRNEVLAAKEAGFEVANHSYDSNGLNSVGPEVIKEKIAKTDALLSEITGYKHFLFRAPNVAYSQAMYAVIEKPFIDVSIWSQDYQDKTTKDDLVNNVINNLKDGGIINMHSVHDKTAEAVPEILEQCKDKGYQVVSVSELFAIKGKKLMTGVKYNNAE